MGTGDDEARGGVAVFPRGAGEGRRDLFGPMVFSEACRNSALASLCRVEYPSHRPTRDQERAAIEMEMMMSNSCSVA